MSEESKSGSVPWPALLAVFLATSGAIFFFSSLDSSRPPPPNKKTARALGYQNVDARLWQDPFQVVYSVEEQREISGPLFKSGDHGNKVGPARMLKDLREQVVEQGIDRVEVLAVMVPAGPYAELAEQRLRIRVAVLEALGRAGLIPQDGEHIGFLEVPWAWQDLSRPSEGRQTIRDAIARREPPFFRIPYEWCVPDGVRMAGVPAGPVKPDSPRKVLVLWLDENVLSDLPLTRLGEFIRQVRTVMAGEPADVASATATRGPQTPCALDFKIIGPRVSTTLRAMLREVASLAPDPASLNALTDSLRGVKMYSGSPTAEAELLRHSVGCDGAGGPVSQALDRVFGPIDATMAGHDPPGASGKDRGDSFYFCRTTPTDDMLCRDLVDELELRDVRLRPQGGWNMSPPAAYSGEDVDDVAIVTEWDTFYGRAIPLSFALAAVTDTTTSAANLKLRDAIIRQGRFPKWIHPFVYLRGIDGQAPGQDQSKAGGETDQDKGSPGESRTPSRTATRLGTPNEPPEGTNGSDYLRRLADQLAETDGRLRRAGGRGLRAVGVLGTDVYDKLLILRALRDRLPGVLFFTTDLDARYSLRSEWPATHNLIVVAPFGLSVTPLYQANLPPFRDSYESAVFATTLAAADVIRPPEFLNRLRPRRFEIGRQGAYDLSTDPGTVPTDPASVEAERSRDLPDGADATTQVSMVRYNLMGWLYGSRVRWLGAVLVFLLAGVVALYYLVRDRGQAVRSGKKVCKAVASGSNAFTLGSVLKAGHAPAGSSDTPDFTALALESSGGQATLIANTGFSDREVGLNGPPGDLPSNYTKNAVGDHVGSTAQGLPGDQSSRLKQFILAVPESVVVVLAAILSVAIVWWISRSQTPDGTPFLWGDGISMWPTEVVRCFVALLAAFWLFRATLEIGTNDNNIEDEFSLHLMTAPPKLRWWQIRYWDTESAAPDRVDVRRLWSEYRSRSGARGRWSRTLLAAILFGLICFSALHLLGMPHPPIRGNAARSWDLAFLRVSGFLSLILLLFVLDGAYLNHLFIERLIAAPSRWPAGSIRRNQTLRGMTDDDLADWMAIRLIAERTKVVGKYIYYPFPLLFLCVAARNSYFADWDWPVGLLLIFTAMFLVAVLAAWLLRRSAEHARQVARERMQPRRLDYIAAGADPAAGVMDKLIESVKQEKRGAFSILSQYPTLAAIVLPSGSFGLWILIEQVAKSGGS